jgi:hypothetical protein
VQVSELRFWSVERTEAQIRDNMYGIAPTTPGLIGYWKCNEGSGNTIADATGNENDAEIFGSGATWKPNQKIEVGK